MSGFKWLAYINFQLKILNFVSGFKCFKYFKTGINLQGPI